MEIIGHVAALWRHPVSSMGGEPLQSARLGPGGIEGDRIWGVADAEGVAAPEKIRRWRGLPSMRARLGLDGPEVETDRGKWAPAGSAEAAAAVSRLIGAPARLLPHCRPDRAEEGRIAPRYVRNDLHLLSTASLRTLAALVPEAAAGDERRFRPNLVVATREGIDGFFEQGLAGRKVVIGEAEIEIEEPCMRCAFTGLGQSLPGADLPFEPKIVHAISAKGAGAFGALCGVRRGGEVRIGDPVTLLPA